MILFCASKESFYKFLWIVRFKFIGQMGFWIILRGIGSNRGGIKFDKRSIYNCVVRKKDYL